MPVSHGLLGSYVKAYILEATRFGMSNMNFLIADVIYSFRQTQR